MSIVTPFFAAALALIYLVLSINIARYRFTRRVSLGDGGDRYLQRAIRAHANFIEYVPLALLLMWFLESLTLSASLPFWLGSVLVAARLAHAFGIYYPRQLMILRHLGIVATFGVLILASAAILQFYLPLTV